MITQGIITILIQLVGWWLGKQADNKEMKKLFYQFVKQLNETHLNSVRLKKSYEKQLEELRKGV